MSSISDQTDFMEQKPVETLSETESNNSLDLDRHFATLEALLADAGEILKHVTAKHWIAAEKEQYPFWIGIIFLSVVGIAGMYLRDISVFGLVIALVMALGLIALIIYYLKNVLGRFERQWSLFAADGELYGFLRDSGYSLEYPVELGTMDEQMSCNVETTFNQAIKVIEAYLRSVMFTDPVPADQSPGFFIPEHILDNPPGGDAHRVYEVEYRGLISRAYSIRVAETAEGCNINISYAPHPKNAESKESLYNSILGRVQDRLVSAKILFDIRERIGLPPAMQPPENNNNNFQ